jgi:hypothetical protein
VTCQPWGFLVFMLTVGHVVVDWGVGRVDPHRFSRRFLLWVLFIGSGLFVFAFARLVHEVRVSPCISEGRWATVGYLFMSVTLLLIRGRRRYSSEEGIDVYPDRNGLTWGAETMDTEIAAFVPTVEQQRWLKELPPQDVGDAATVLGVELRGADREQTAAVLEAAVWIGKQREEL